MDPIEISPGNEERKEDRNKEKGSKNEANLEEEVKNLTGRLKEMEKYKDLCEKKLIEQQKTGVSTRTKQHASASKDYPRKGSNDFQKLNQQLQAKDQEVHKLLQRNEKLNAENIQLKQNLSGKVGGEIKTGEASERILDLERSVEELTKQKMTLEDSLRGEVLISEEQRNYIEILKEALEAKIEDLGLKEILSKEKGSNELCDVFAQFAAMKKELDYKKKEAGLTMVNYIGNIKKM